MKKLASVFTLFCIANSIYSQILFSPRLEKFEYLQHKYYVDVIIDARFDKSTSVGLLKDNSGIQLIDFENDIKQSLFDFFNYALGPKSNSVPIAIKINDLEYNKKYFGAGLEKELVWMYADYEVFLKQDGNKWIKLTKAQEVVEAQVPMPDENYSLNFSELTWLFWNKAFQEIEDIKLKKKTDLELFTDDDIKTAIARPPILTDTLLKGGVYMSYQEFLANDPSIIDIGVNENGVYLKDANSNQFVSVKPIHNVWGFSDGYNLFVNYKNSCDFIPLERVGTSFESVKSAPKAYISEDRQNGISAARGLILNDISYKNMQSMFSQQIGRGFATNTLAVTPTPTIAANANLIGGGLLLVFNFIEMLSSKGKVKRLVLNNGVLKAAERYVIPARK